MQRLNIERFLATSETHLRGADETPQRLPLAVHLLKREFRRALAEGPQALVTAMESMTDPQTTLAQAFWRMLDDDDTLLNDLLVELRHGNRDDVIEFLADRYARWVLASYEQGACDER
jgi:hypothetical protein